MMDLIGNLGLGFATALTPLNLLFALVGSLVGTLVGVLPGIGPLAALAMLLPATFLLQPLPALIMMAGIYYGAQYGGSTSAILINIPGESSSVITCLDGYQMARKGRAGAALAVAALASLFAGTIATIIIAIAAPPLASVALQFGPADYFSLMVLGLVAAIVLAQGSILKALCMIGLGLLLGVVGTDVNAGVARLTFGSFELADGISLVPLVMGLFALPEIIRNIDFPEGRSVLNAALDRIWPSRDDVRRAWPAAVRGTTIGAILGVLPGGGALLSSFAAYMVEKRISRDPSRFGTGMIEGVAAPEAANNAGAQTSFIPLLTLGIPGNAVTALMVGVMMIHGIRPGPNIVTEQPALFWGLICSMLIGNLMLVVINLPMIPLWVRLLKVRYRLLYPSIVLFCCIGAYSVGNSILDVLFLFIFGVLGEILYRLKCEPAPLVLAFVLGPLMEENFRRAMLMARGDLGVIVTEPISLGLLITAGLILLVVILPVVRRTRAQAFSE